MVSPVSVRYIDGAIKLNTTDLQSAGFGTSWGQTRSWASNSSYTPLNINGLGWNVTQLPFLLQSSDQTKVVLVTSGTDARYFDGSTYTPRFFYQEQLRHSGNMFTLTDTTGNQLTFNDFSFPPGQRGQLTKVQDPFGPSHETTVHRDPETGQVTEVDQSDAGGYQRFVYAYAGFNGPLASVALEQRTPTGPWTTIRQVSYVYYNGTTANGNRYGDVGDLRSATILDGSRNVLDVFYYRYYYDRPFMDRDIYDSHNMLIGYAHGLKYVFSSQSYARLKAAGMGDPLLVDLTDDQVQGYADDYFEYDAQRRATKVIAQGAGCSSCTGGQGTFTYLYDPNPNPPSLDLYNSWNFRTTETLPDGNQNIVYTNAFGEVMLKDFHDITTNQDWNTFYHYDSQGRLDLTANPSAVTGYDPSTPDLLHADSHGHYQYMKDNDGLVDYTVYASTTTAGEGTVGDVKGYVQATYVQQGQPPTGRGPIRVLQSEIKYKAHMASQVNGGATVYPVATRTVYQNTNRTGAETTSYSYQWWLNHDTTTVRMSSRTVIQPVIDPAENGPGIFGPAQSYAVGQNPASVATGDFNTDGSPDLAVANSGSNTVSVLLGNPNGTFRTARNYPTGADPVAVAVGDFTGTGVLDLAVANFGSGTVSVLLGNGDGSFQPSRQYAAGPEPTAIAVGDFNGDGIPDLAVANGSSGTVSILLGQGKGTFAPPRAYVTGNNPTSVAVGDFNGDGIADLAVTNAGSGTVSVLLGIGDGRFQPARNYVAGVSPAAVAVGDFSGNGRLGLAVANSGSGTVSVLLGNGDGSFQNAVNFSVGTAPVSVAVGDFKGDGKLGLAVANSGSGTVSILLGNGDGTFQPVQNYAAGSSPYSVAVADFNSDDFLDFVVANDTPSGTVSVVLGGASGDTTTSLFDTYGRLIRQTDADGFVTTHQYDVVTGAETQKVQDAGAGHLNLTTTMVVDGLGRTTQLTDPNGNVTYTVYNDPKHEVRTYPGWTGTTTTGPTQVTREVRPDAGRGNPLFVETLTMTAPPNPPGGVPDGSEAIDSVQTLSRRYTNNAGQFVRSDAYYNLAGVYYSPAPYLGTEGTNYYKTLYDYDERGRLNRTQLPTGTIQRTVYDGLSRVVSTWVGTNDMPQSGTWSPTNNTPPANMVQQTASVYDGGVGDGNLTQLIQFPGNGADPRVTQNYYDWRDRLVATKHGGGNENDGTHRPITYRYYDNLNEATVEEQYDGDGVTVTTTNGVPDPPPANRRRTRREMAYDDQGRVYQTRTFWVDQSLGNFSANSLTTNTWYDHRGNVIKTSPPGGVVTKTSYDGAGRVKKTYQTDEVANPSWTEAGTIANNNVLSQTETQYDAASNVIFQIRKDRFHNETTAGELGNVTTAPLARVSYLASYYDLANRLTITVDLGTNGGTTLNARPTPAPDRSSPVLRTDYAYGDAGWVQLVTDPRGIQTQTTYDMLGRTTQTVEAYDGGPRTDSTNRTTQFTYDGSNHVLTQTALGASVPEQTQYIYGVTGPTISSNDLLANTIYPYNGRPNTESYTYNALGEVVTKTDRNGTTHAYSYDVLERKTSDTVLAFGSNVDQQIQRIDTAYDTGGRPYLYTSYGDTAGLNIRNQVQQAYNGLGQLITEYQAHDGAVNVSTSPNVQYGYSFVQTPGGPNHSRLISITYPNGRQIAYTYSGLDDSLSRVTALSDNTTPVLEGYSYLGLGTVVTRSHPEAGTDLTYVNQPGGSTDGGDPYTGLDRFGRVIDQLWGPGAAPTDRFRYTYDPDGNRLTRDAVNTAFNEQYGYDTLNRLTSFTRGSHTQAWGLDILGNWGSFTTDTNPPQFRTHNLQNQITSISDLTTPRYDNNGNTILDQNNVRLVYDAWDRLIRYEGTPTVSYTYDALNRRITTASGGTSTDLFYSSSWQVLEEQVGGVMQTQYVWSPVYVDALVLRDTPNQETQRLYVQQDANWNVTALVGLDSMTGLWQVQERYVYDPYGRVTVLAADWTSRGTSSFGWVYLHQGGRLDSATGLYLFRHRDYSPTLGRWMQQDPLGYVDGMNLYQDERSNPLYRVDPTGLLGCPLGAIRTNTINTCPAGNITKITETCVVATLLGVKLSGFGFSINVWTITRISMTPCPATQPHQPPGDGIAPIGSQNPTPQTQSPPPLDEDEDEDEPHLPPDDGIAPIGSATSQTQSPTPPPTIPWWRKAGAWIYKELQKRCL
jgi:RHS repeat-associated protein